MFSVSGSVASTPARLLPDTPRYLIRHRDPRFTVEFQDVFDGGRDPVIHNVPTKLVFFLNRRLSGILRMCGAS